MQQRDAEHQRIQNALLGQVAGHSEDRYIDICAHSEGYIIDSRNYFNWLLSVLYQRNWDAYYSIEQRTDDLRNSVTELNKRLRYLEQCEKSGDGDKPLKGNAFDEGKIDRFLDHIQNEIVKTKGRQKKERLRLAVFTPLTPLKNGIADYMTVILIALKQYADIDIYIDEGYEPSSPDILQSFEIYQHDRFHKLHGRYDLILYEIGNNPHHGYIVPYALQYPGVLELHDFNLNYLCRHLPLKYQRIACTESICARYPEGCADNPLNMYLLKASLGVVVHSEFSRQAVFDESMSLDVRKVEHFAKVALGEQNATDLVKKHKLEDCFIFACFGFATYAKRIEEIIISFAHVVRKYPKVRFKLLIVGEFSKDYLSVVRDQIRKCHVKKYVVMTGYVTLSDMHRYIGLTDVCLNLRYPYGGESSGTLARIMGMGKACIVNRIGAFDEMPDTCCHKIEYEGNRDKEIENITGAMSILFENSVYRKWIAGNAQAYVMEHLNLNRAIQLYREILNYFYCKPAFDVDRLMRKASSFLAYNYFDNPHHAAEYFTSKLHPFFYGEASDGQ